MSIKKNVASQKVVFLMVDETDFATPETGVSVTAKYSKDGGDLSTCSNAVSAITSGLYKITLAQTETNGDVMAYQFTGTGCADQWLTVYPETVTANVSAVLSTIDAAVHSTLDAIHSTIDGPVISDLSSIEADTAAILTDTGSTLQNQVAAILTDTGTTLENRQVSVLGYVTNLESAIDGQIHSTLDAIHSTLDGVVTSDLSNIESIVVAQGTGGASDWSAKELAQIRSALGISGATSALQGYGIKSTVTNILSTIDGPVTSDLSSIESIVTAQGTSGSADWSASEQAQIRSALGITGTTSALAAYGVNSRLDNATYGLDALETLTSQILTDTGTTLQNQVASILVDTKSTLSNQILSIVDDSSKILSTIDNATIGLDAIETIASLILSTIDGPVTSDLSSIEADTAAILVDTGTTLENRQISILADVATIESAIDGQIHSTLDAIHSTIDGPVTSDLSSIEADTAAILVDTGTTLENRQVSILANVTNLESAIDGQLHSTLDAIHSTVDGPVTSMLSSIEAITDRQGKITIAGTAQTGTLSTTQMTTDLTVGVADQYNGRILTFNSDTTTANLRNVQTDITDTVVAGGLLTFTAIPTAPANGDTFEIT